MSSQLNISNIKPLTGSGTINIGSTSSNTIQVNTTTQTITSVGTLEGNTIKGIGANTVNYTTPMTVGGETLGGRRNIIINGAMKVSQRGTSFTSVAGSAYHLDRYRTGMGDTTARFTVTQNTVSDLPGFTKSLKYDCTTAEPSLSNADARLFVSHRMEGQDLQQLMKGTSSAKQVTVSFYVKSTKTGTYILNIVDADNNRQISKAYTVLSSGTWERKSLTFAGDTSGALGNDNGHSLALNFWLLANTNYAGGTLATSWQGYAGASDYEDAAVGQVNLGDNTSNTWEITGLQMEVGTVVTPFEHMSFGEEMNLCQRYYFQVIKNQYGALCSGRTFNSKTPFFAYPFPVAMRALPSVAELGTGGLGVWYVSGSFASVTGAAYYQENANQTDVQNVSLVFDAVSALTDAAPITLAAATNDDGIGFDAEL